jgi:NAD(P)H-dependent FMN reductase
MRRAHQELGNLRQLALACRLDRANRRHAVLTVRKRAAAQEGIKLGIAQLRAALAGAVVRASDFVRQRPLQRNRHPRSGAIQHSPIHSHASAPTHESRRMADIQMRRLLAV